MNTTDKPGACVLRAKGPRVEVESKRTDKFTGGWSAVVIVEGKKFSVGVSRGNRVRMAYAGNRYGYHWYGNVYEFGGKRLLQLRVPKDSGVYYLLEMADLVPMRKATALRTAKDKAFNEIAKGTLKWADKDARVAALVAEMVK